MAQQRFLVSDIGGTNIRVASFREDPRLREMETTYRIDSSNGKPFKVLDALKDYREKSKIDFTGEGIRRIYTFLQNPSAVEVGAPKSEEITTAAAMGNLPADDVRAATVNLYLKILGAAAGNLALTYTATGGIYLGGSICLGL